MLRTVSRRAVVRNPNFVTPCAMSMFRIVAIVSAALATQAQQPAAGTLCFMDYDASGRIDVSDLLMLLAAFGSTNSNIDSNSDGRVNVEDLLALLAAFGSDSECATSPSPTPTPTQEGPPGEMGIPIARTCAQQGQAWLDGNGGDWWDAAVWDCMSCCLDAFPISDEGNEVCLVYQLMAPPDPEACASCHQNCNQHDDMQVELQCHMQCDLDCEVHTPCAVCHSTCDIQAGIGNDDPECHCECDANECDVTDSVSPMLAAMSTDCDICHLECDDQADDTCTVRETTACRIVAAMEENGPSSSPSGGPIDDTTSLPWTTLCDVCHSACDQGPAEPATKSVCGAYCSENAPGDHHCLTACSGFNANLAATGGFGTMNDICHDICDGRPDLCHIGCTLGPRCEGSETMMDCQACKDNCFANAMSGWADPECLADCDANACGYTACKVCNNYCIGMSPAACVPVMTNDPETGAAECDCVQPYDPCLIRGSCSEDPTCDPVLTSAPPPTPVPGEPTQPDLAPCPAGSVQIQYCCNPEVIENQPCADFDTSICPESTSLPDLYSDDYLWFEIVGNGGTRIQEHQWENPLNTWNHDDGYVDIELNFAFSWFQQDENVFTIGTNGVVTFGSAHLRSGGTEPIPCVNLCANNEYYDEAGSSSNTHSHIGWGMDGLFAPFWADLLPGLGGRGAVYYKVMTRSAVVQWDGVPYWDHGNMDTHVNTFEAIMWDNGGLMFSYQQMSPVHVSWAAESIGYEDGSGTVGVQISYGEIPPSRTTYYIPPTCTNIQSPHLGPGSPAVNIGESVDIIVRITVLTWGNEIQWSIDGGSRFGPYSDHTTEEYELSLAAGQHRMFAFDTFGDGWHGGYWTIIDPSDNSIIAGGPGAGQVSGSGGEIAFTLSPGDGDSVEADVAANVDITVLISVETWGNEIIWNIDNGQQFGPYTDHSDNYEQVSLPPGHHTFYYIDTYGDGWHGGWWELLPGSQTSREGITAIAGGPTAGQVHGHGGSQAFDIEEVGSVGGHGLDTINMADTVQVNVQITTVTWGNEITWNIDGGPTFGPYSDHSTTDHVIDLSVGEHILYLFDSFGDGWHGGYWTIIDPSDNSIIAGGSLDGQISGSGGEAAFIVSQSANGGGVEAQVAPAVDVTVHISVLTWGNEIVWNIDNGQQFGPYSDHSEHYEVISLPPGDHTLNYIDTFGDGWHGGYWELLAGAVDASSVDDAETLAGGPAAGQVSGHGGSTSFTLYSDPFASDGDVPVQPDSDEACPPSGFSTVEYYFFDISGFGNEILDTEWVNPANTWQHDDGYIDVPLPWTFPFYGSDLMFISIDTNGFITFGDGHLAAGETQPIPCPGDCGDTQDISGLIAPFWADLNPGSSLDGTDEDGAVFYMIYSSEAVVQWNKVTYFSLENDPTAQTFQAIMWDTGGFMFSYQDMDSARISQFPESIGYEDHDGTSGVQISYEEIPSSGTSYWVAPACTAARADDGRRLEAMEEVSRRRGLGSAGLRAPPSNALIGSRAKSERLILNRFGDDNPKEDKMYGTNYVQQQQQQQQQ